MFPPLEAGCDHQAGEEHALMHLPDPQVQNTDSIFHTRRQNWRDIMESYSSETTLLQTHAAGAIPPELFLAFAAPSKSLNILSI